MISFKYQLVENSHRIPCVGVYGSDEVFLVENVFTEKKKKKNIDIVVKPLSTPPPLRWKSITK